MIDTKELRRLAQATNEHSDDRAEILAEFYAATQSDTIIELLDRLEAAESARRDDYQNWMTALDRNAELLAKLEAAEKELAELRSSMKFRTRLIGRTEAERDTLRIENEALRAEVAHVKEVEFPRKAQAVADGWRGKCERLEAKIEQMERQEPVATVRINAINGNPSVDFVPGHRYLHHNDKLYLAPGAQPKPDCGEAGHDDGRCGNRQCLPGAKGEEK